MLGVPADGRFLPVRNILGQCIIISFSFWKMMWSPGDLEAEQAFAFVLEDNKDAAQDLCEDNWSTEIMGESTGFIMQKTNDSKNDAEANELKPNKLAVY